MTSAAPKTQTQELLEEFEAKAKKKKAAGPSTPATVAKRVAEKDYDIDNNTFAKIVFDPALAPEQKKEAIAKALVFDVEAPKEENQKRLKEFDLFKEYLQSERQRMAQEIISLTDTEAFSEMHEMFNEMNGAIVEFDNSMKPLTDILDAVYKLRQEGPEMTLEVFKEIESDKVAQAEREQQLLEKGNALVEAKNTISSHTTRIAELKEQKSFFGFGKVKQKARVEIARLQLELDSAEEAETTLTAEVEEITNAPPPDTKFAEWAEEKARLRELLDISSDEHKERQQRLINSAQTFVNTTEMRGDQVLEHFGQMGEQIDTLSDANRGIQSIYAIVTEGSTEASRLNKETRDQLAVPAEGETPISQMQRENKKIDIEEHMITNNNSAADTMKTYADLTEQGARIITMKNANREQVSKARELTSSGVAGVAEGLSSVLTIVSAAALNESAELARNSVGIMEERTNFQSQKESLRQAAGIKDQADIMEKAIESLEAYRDTARVVADTTRENLQEVKSSQERLQALINETRENIDKQRSAPAEVDMQGTDATAKTEEAAVEAPKKDTGLAKSKIAGLGRG